MPTYDYLCDACGHEFELFQSITESVKKKCPECGKLKLRRLFGTGAAIVFKGSGFYQTDYRSESYKQAAAKDQKPSEGGTSEGGSGDKGSGSASGSDGKANQPASGAKPSPAKKESKRKSD